MSLNVSLGPWKADEAVSSCESCGKGFDLFHRRHHCRCCGCIFCSACTRQTFIIPTFPSLIPQRVCKDCHTLLANREAGRAQQQDQMLLRPSRDDSGREGQVALSTSLAVKSREERQSEAEGPWLPPSVGGSSLPSDDLDVADGSYGDECDTVSTAVAGILSSWSEQRQTNSVSFLPVLKDSILRSGELPLLNVLLFPSPQCYTVSVLTPNAAETMGDLIQQLVEPYFRLSNGPFKKITDSTKEQLRTSLHFFSEMQQIAPELPAAQVMAHCTHVVLTSLSLAQFEKERDTATRVSSLRHFFSHERPLPAEGNE